MARRNYGDEKEVPKIQSIAAPLLNMVMGGVMAWACMAATGTSTLIFIDDGTADCTCTVNSEVNSNSKCLQTHWTALHPAT